MKIVLEAIFGQSPLKIGCNPERDVVILNLSHMCLLLCVLLSIYIGATFDLRVGAVCGPSGWLRRHPLITMGSAAWRKEPLFDLSIIA